MTEILDYPYPLDLQWSHIDWYPILFKREPISDFKIHADWEVKGVASELMTLAMKSHPPATLSKNERWIAFHLKISWSNWLDLMGREITPLHEWVDVQCGDVIRLTHPLLLEGLEVAVKAADMR